MLYVGSASWGIFSVETWRAVWVPPYQRWVGDVSSSSTVKLMAKKFIRLWCFKDIKRTSKVDPDSAGLHRPMEVTREVDRVVGDVDEE